MKKNRSADVQSAGHVDVAAPRTGSGAVARGSGLMALGSLVSRATGFVRAAVVVAALGTGLLNDAYSVANTLPNIVFMLLIGGALNSVFVPELVRAVQHADGGRAYTDRLLTACVAGLAGITAMAVVAAPWLARLYAPVFTGDQLNLTVALARYCLPQIFFYGLFAVLGQVLNARDRFGAMMWTPVVNNLVVIGVFGLYLGIARDTVDAGQITEGQEMLLGAGSTLGIVTQALALLPTLRRAGFRWRPRFDWRGSGLTRPLRAAGWTVLLIAINQVAYWAITSLATGVSKRAAAEHLTVGVGLAAYSNAYQLWVFPQGIVTVSLVTAVLPGLTRAAVLSDFETLGADLARTIRSSAGLIVLSAFGFLTLAPQLTGLAYGYGRTTPGDVQVLAQVLACFAPGLPAFCAQYALTRGFYALGDARTPVLLALVVSGCNAGLCVVAVQALPPRWAVTGMAAAQTLACLAGVVCTSTALRRRIGALSGVRLAVAHARAAVACLPGAAVAPIVARWSEDCLGHGLAGNLTGVAAGGLALGLSLLLLAGPLGVPEAAAPLRTALRRPRGGVRARHRR